MKKIITVCRWKRSLAFAALGFLAAWVAALPTEAASAPFGVPVRLSFKFILNSSGNRPSTGNLNTDEEILAQIVWGNDMYARFGGEIRLHNVEILDVSGQSAYYSYTSSTADRDALRTAAIANPSAFYWRNNAINVYITGGSGSAISDFPSDNNIILCTQGSHDTTIPHEMGHSVNLYHTHETCCGGDGCTDTLADDDTWNSQDDIALGNYGVAYASLTSGQQYNVNMVWSNIMSYHNVDSRSMISPCQLERVSTQTYTDRTWLLSKVPVYVDVGYVGPFFLGSFTQPYQNVQQAITAGVLNDKVMVLKTGTHPNPSSVISTAIDVVTRKGTSTIKDAPPLYDLPYNLEDSTNAVVRDAVIRAQKADRQRDLASVIANLKEAETNAKGREKLALQLELAHRHRDIMKYDEAAQWFQKVADGADQPKLRSHALVRVDRMKTEAAKFRQGKAAPAQNKPEKTK